MNIQKFIRLIRYPLAIILVVCNIGINPYTATVYAEPTENTGNTGNTESTENAENTQNPGTSPERQISWPAAPSIYAETGVLIEASTGAVLYDKNCHQKMYPASITKILTTLIALEEGNLSDMVEYYHYDVFSLELGDAHIARQEGELLSLKDTLMAVMLASANECANATGEYVARKSPEFQAKINELKAAGESYDESKVALEIFSDMMNERAKKAGALGSHFVNPNGLFNEDHYTTCYDMAMITREASKNDDFLKLESSVSYTIPVTNKNAEPQAISNRHQMMHPSNPVYYEGILGGKTGYVDQSGTTLVTFAKRNGMTLISVVMRSNGANVYNDTKLLLDYGFNNFSLQNISENETTFSVHNNSGHSNLSSVFGSKIPVLQMSDKGNVVLPKGADISDCTSELIFLDSENQTDNRLAEIKYSYNNTPVGSTFLVINSSEDEQYTFGPAKNKPTSAKKKNNNFITINIWIIVIILVVLAIAVFILRYTHSIQSLLRKNRRRRRMKRNRGYRKRRNKNKTLRFK